MLLVRAVSLAKYYFKIILWVSKNWKPGAISKRLFRLLDKAKNEKSTAATKKPLKKPNNLGEDKPTITITKKDGEYTIEMQVADKSINEEYTPVIYRIVKQNNEDYVKKRKQREQTLVREAIKNVWIDPYNSEVCEKTCMKAYRQATGAIPFDPNDPECVCPKEEVQTINDGSCGDTDFESSSLDLDWEIQYSPPSTYQM